MNTEDRNKIIIKDRKLLHIVEVFMGYSKGYLSEIITWNDIMPVVEKIEDTWIGSARGTLRIDGSSLQLWHGIDNGCISFATGILRGNRIKNLWRAVVEFIQWYNKEQEAQVSDTTEAK